MIRLIASLVFLLLAGCHPKPDTSIVLWEQPAPVIAAHAHAREIGGAALMVMPTGSMEPMISGGDWIVVDPKFPFEKLKPGDVVNYQASWLPPGSFTVTHMAAAKSGDKWIMGGIANQHYENAANGGLHMGREEYRGKVVQVYTKRTKV